MITMAWILRLLLDKSWDKAIFEVVNGNTSRSWERLDAFVIVPLYLTCSIIFCDMVYVCVVGSLLDMRLLAKYGSVFSVVAMVAMFIYLVATPSKSNLGKASSKKKRQVNEIKRTVSKSYFGLQS
ncbi:unnamed protein product [Cochlearia groenlandica]